jgi:hypothetical protein
VGGFTRVQHTETMIKASKGMMINPTMPELKRNMRENLYEWDEVKSTITEDGLLVWLEDVHHVDFMTYLGIDYRERYDIVINLPENFVEMTKLYDKEYSIEDIQNVRDNKHLCSLLKDFDVCLENLDCNM